MSCVELSLKCPVAVNACVLPRLTVESAGAITIELSVPVPTVRVVVPFMPEALAVTVTEPFFFARAIPFPRTCAMLGLDVFQVSPLR